MELRHLKYFLTLAEELHFGKAADKLFISQPPLSRLIKSLEIELGVPLFERNNRNVKLTKYGEYLKSQANDIFTRIHQTTNQLKIMNTGAQSPIKIGYAASVMYVFLPDVLKKLKTKYPEAKTVLIELDSKNQLMALSSGEIDIGFLRTNETHSSLEFEHIYDEPFTLIYSKRHRFENQKKVEIKDFKYKPFITFTSACSAMIGINKIFNKCVITPNIIHRTSQINTILRLVESNVGYAIVPSSVLKGFNLNLKRINLSDFPERTPIYIAYKQREITEIIKEFIQIIKNTNYRFESGKF